MTVVDRSAPISPAPIPPLPPERLMPAEDVAEMAWSAWSLSARSVVEDIVMRPQLGDIGEGDFQ